MFRLQEVKQNVIYKKDQLYINISQKKRDQGLESLNFFIIFTCYVIIFYYEKVYALKEFIMTFVLIT